MPESTSIILVGSFVFVVLLIFRSCSFLVVCFAVRRGRHVGGSWRRELHTIGRPLRRRGYRRGRRGGSTRGRRGVTLRDRRLLAWSQGAWDGIAVAVTNDVAK
jgi:hypothetical protein